MATSHDVPDCSHLNPPFQPSISLDYGGLSWPVLYNGPVGTNIRLSPTTAWNSQVSSEDSLTDFSFVFSCLVCNCKTIPLIKGPYTLNMFVAWLQCVWMCEAWLRCVWMCGAQSGHQLLLMFVSEKDKLLGHITPRCVEDFIYNFVPCNTPAYQRYKEGITNEW